MESRNPEKGRLTSVFVAPQVGGSRQSHHILFWEKAMEGLKIGIKSDLYGVAFKSGSTGVHKASRTEEPRDDAVGAGFIPALS